MAGAGVYRQASLGGAGETAFDLRILLVSLAVVGALPTLAARARTAGTNVTSAAFPRGRTAVVRVRWTPGRSGGPPSSVPREVLAAAGQIVSPVGRVLPQ
jgi:hypothetical protein